jgi:hypothetical protein
LAFPVSAEVYRYVDDRGHIHFTDDLNQVPLEKRATASTSVEYESSVAQAQMNSDEESEQMDNSAAADEVSADFTEEGEENTDDFSDTTQDVQPIARQQETEENFETTPADTRAGTDLEATRSRLEAMKKAIDGEYQDLVKEKEQLAEEKKSLKNQTEILNYNQKVKNLNQKVAAYAKKGELYQAAVEAYNEQIRLENAKIKQQQETP